MKKILSALIGFGLLASPAFAQKIPVEGWFKGTNTKVGEMWRFPVDIADSKGVNSSYHSSNGNRLKIV